MTRARDIANSTSTLDVDGGTIKLDGNHPVGTGNVALGDTALDSNVSGLNNTAIGAEALTANTASNNTAVGYQAGYNTTTGLQNVFVGRAAAKNSTTGTYLTAVGDAALELNTTGNFNTGIGYSALRSNTTANNNTALGYQAGYSNTTGNGHVAVGLQALYATQTSTNNTAVGMYALYSDSTGSSNVAVGRDALQNNTTASYNTAVGYQAGYANTTAQTVTYIGYQAGFNATGANNTFVGTQAGYAITTGAKNTILGRYDGNQGGLDIRTSSNNIVLSDGDGNPRAYYEGAGSQWYIKGAANGFWATIIQQETSGSTPYGLKIQYPNTAPDNQSGVFLAAEDSVGFRFYVWNDGDVVNHDNSYGAISDVKLKEQITDASSQWDDIKALTVRKYKMKSDVTEKGDSDDLWRLGVVAQEVEAAGMSGLVKESPDRDADNNDLGTTTKEVKYSILYMKAVKALQEAMDRIETLEAKVAALESN